MPPDIGPLLLVLVLAAGAAVSAAVLHARAALLARAAVGGRHRAGRRPTLVMHQRRIVAYQPGGAR